MKTLFISLPTAEAVHTFVTRISRFDGQFDMLSGSYVLDARSLMSILSLDLSKPMKLRIENDTAEVMRAINDFFVEEMDD